MQVQEQTRYEVWCSDHLGRSWCEETHYCERAAHDGAATHRAFGHGARVEKVVERRERLADEPSATEQPGTIDPRLHPVMAGAIAPFAPWLPRSLREEA